MTPEDYIKYIDDLIVKVNRSIHLAKMWGDSTECHVIELETLNDLKSKFLTIEYPSQEPDNQNSFTNGFEE